MSRSIFVSAAIILAVYCTPSIVKAEPVGEPPPPANNQIPAAPPSGQNLTGQVADLRMGSEAPAPAAVPAPIVQATQIIASTESDWPDVTADILELKRTSGDTLTLKFAINNASSENLEFSYDFGSGSTSDYGNIAGVHLLDPTNKKKYLVVRDSDGKCVCSVGQKPITPGAKRNLWAKFPAPPANVSKATVQIPHFIPLEDVPIS